MDSPPARRFAPAVEPTGDAADARWFTADALPGIPQRLSIARRLIDRYAAKYGVTLTDP